MHKRLLGKAIDIDANLLHADLRESLHYHVDNAVKRGIEMFVVPGSSLTDSLESIELVKQHPLRFVATAGVHPYNTETCTFSPENQALLEKTLRESSTRFRSTVSDADSPNSITCVGECGLDYTDGFPDKSFQLSWFRYQVQLARDHRLPLYFHVRNAHDDFMTVLHEEFASLPAVGDDKVQQDNFVSETSTSHVFTSAQLPNHSPDPLKINGVVHCFTGSYEDLCCYLDTGLYVGLTGYILTHTAPIFSGLPSVDSSGKAKDSTESHLEITGFKSTNPERDQEMKKWLERITLERLLIETDAPYMGFKGCRVVESVDNPKSNKKRNSTQRYPNLPSAMIILVEYICSLTGWKRTEVLEMTTRNAIELFQIRS